MVLENPFLKIRMMKISLILKIAILVTWSSCFQNNDARQEAKSPTLEERKRKQSNKGILAKIPEDPTEVRVVKTRNIWRVDVKANNQVLIRNEEVKIADITPITKEFIDNPDHKMDLSESPRNAIVSLKNERGADYKVYLNVYNALLAAYHELWNIEAQQRFNLPFDSLNYAQAKEVKTKIPLVISEAEEDGFE